VAWIQRILLAWVKRTSIIVTGWNCKVKWIAQYFSNNLNKKKKKKKTYIYDEIEENMDVSDSKHVVNEWEEMQPFPLCPTEANSAL
jgi:hypothetical protein